MFLKRIFVTFILAFVASAFFATNAFAGLFELSATGNYRKTSVDDLHYSIASYGTGGLAYYFWELSAIETSYTRGNSATIQPNIKIYSFFEMYEINLLITFAGKESAFKPYIKVGGAYTVRKVSEENPNVDPIRTESKGFSPVAGAGFKIMLSQQFAIKAGVDANSTPTNQQPVVYDYNAYAGLSFLF